MYEADGAAVAGEYFIRFLPEHRHLLSKIKKQSKELCFFQIAGKVFDCEKEDGQRFAGASRGRQAIRLAASTLTAASVS